MMKRIAFFLYGCVCYLIFFGTFLYSIGFIGNFAVPRTLDGIAAMPMGIAAADRCGVASIVRSAIQHYGSPMV